MPYSELRYFSDVLGKHTAADVILPDRKLPPPYPVLFLLHGLSDDYTGWARRTSIERHVGGLPLIVVMPDGGRSFYCDAAEGPAYGHALGEELPEVIRHYFPTRPGWAISGNSMGGYGAFRLALNYPDTFLSAVSHSGALAFGHHYGWDAENDFGREFRRVLGPDPVGGPNDLFHLTATVRPLPALRMDCGDADFLLPANRAFHAHLTEIGVQHEYEEAPGEHNWGYWDQHVQSGIAFHCRALGIG